MRRCLPLVVAALLTVSIPSARPAAAEGGMDQMDWYALGAFHLPFGNFGDFAGPGFGLGFGGSYPYSPELAFRGELGYTFFGGEEEDLGAAGSYEYSVSMIPILALAEWHVDPNAPFYLLGGLGFFHVTVDTDITLPQGSIFGGISTGGSASDTDIGLAAGGGFAVAEQVNLEGRLYLISDTSQITVNGTYTF